jgi:hypothetical protein
MIENTSENQRETNYREFDGFQWKNWVDWILALLHNAPIPPFVYKDKEESKNQTLINTYNNLSGRAKDFFKEGLFSVYESTTATQKNSRDLRVLLEAIAYIKPPQAKNYLKRQLFSEIFTRLDCEINLQRLLVLALSKYDVEDDTANYIFCSTKDNDEIPYLLACLKALSFRSFQETLEFLDIFIPKLKDISHAYKLGRVLKDILNQNGYYNFCRWYGEKSKNFLLLPNNLSENILKKPDIDQTYFDYFEKALMRVTFEDEIDNILPTDLDELIRMPAGLEGNNPKSADIASMVLICAQIKAWNYKYNAPELFYLANIATKVDVETGSSALANIWRKRSLQSQNWQPWRYSPEIYDSKGFVSLVSYDIDGSNPLSTIRINKDANYKIHTILTETQNHIDGIDKPKATGAHT